MITFDIFSIFPLAGLSDAESQLKSFKTAISDFVKLNVEERDKITFHSIKHAIFEMLHSHRLTNNNIGKTS